MLGTLHLGLLRSRGSPVAIPTRLDKAALPEVPRSGRAGLILWPG